MDPDKKVAQGILSDTVRKQKLAEAHEIRQVLENNHTVIGADALRSLRKFLDLARASLTIFTAAGLVWMLVQAVGWFRALVSN